MAPGAHRRSRLQIYSRFYDDSISPGLSNHPQFLKRATQLTGITIPDPAIQKLRIVEDALSLFTKKPEPKKLAEALLARPDLLALPNVEIFSKRHTPIDKEMEVGRWKVIEQELKKRDLPVTGHR